MKNLKFWLQDDAGGIDMVQLVVGLLMIAIASVGTLQSLYYGYEKLDQEMRHRKAIHVARSYMEALQGRIHTDFDFRKPQDVRWMGGNLNTGYRALLDERDPTTELDDIECNVAHGRIVPIDLPTTGAGYDYYQLFVRVEWDEPNDPVGKDAHSVEFTAYMVQKDL